MLGLFMQQNYRLFPNRFKPKTTKINTAIANQIHIMISSHSLATTLRPPNFVNSMERSELVALFSGHAGAVYDAVWWDASQRWVTAGGDGVVAQWEPDGVGKALLHHSGAFFSVAVAGDWLFAGTASGEVMVLHRDGRVPQRVEAHRNGVFALVPVADALWSGDGAGQILQWQCENGRWLPLRATPTPDGTKVRTLLPHGGHFVVGTSGGWLGRFHPDRGFTPFHGVPATGHYAALRLPNRPAWLVADGDGHLRVYDDTGQQVYAFPAHQGPVYRMVRVGTRIWTASRDKSIKAWHAHDLTPQDKVTFKSGGHTRSVNALSAALTPAGWQLLTGGDDRKARLFGLSPEGCLATNPPAPRPEPPATHLPD